MNNVARVIREYGQAMRGDWSEIDGRSVREQMNAIAGWVEYPDRLESNGGTVNLRWMRMCLGLCPEGNGHWEMYCDEMGCHEE